MASNLEHLLRRIRDRAASPEEVETARALVASDDRLPAELREIVLQEEAEMPSDAAGLLAVLGADDLGELLAEAIQAEAKSSSPGPPELEAQERDPAWQVVARSLMAGLRQAASSIEVADTVLRQLPSLQGWVWGAVVADAVRSEAGRVEVAEPVLSALSVRDPAVPVAAAVRSEAGRVEVVDAVMRTLAVGEPELPLADAIRAEAGQVELADSVVRALGLEMPPAVAPAPSEVQPVNNNRFWIRAVVAFAAMFLAVVVGSRLPGQAEPEALVFASADEVIIEDLSFGDHANGMVDMSGDDGALILWVDEEA